MSKGIRFTDEFKKDAVAQVVERGLTRVTEERTILKKNRSGLGPACAR
ncbi:MAG: hypothetical protein ACJA1F_002353 [Paracoccaceae bacterium]|jgi:transposase-like protein